MSTVTVTRESDVQFVEHLPSPRGRAAPASDAIVAQACRQNPGKFAVLPLEGRNPLYLSNHLSGSGSTAFPRGEFRISKRGDEVLVAFAVSRAL